MPTDTVPPQPPLSARDHFAARVPALPAGEVVAAAAAAHVVAPAPPRARLADPAWLRGRNRSNCPALLAVAAGADRAAPLDAGHWHDGRREAWLRAGRKAGVHAWWLPLRLALAPFWNGGRLAPPERGPAGATE